MGSVYVATSKGLQEWGSDVGLTKHLYKVGLTEDTGEEAVAKLNAETCAGHADWELVDERETDVEDEEAVIARLASRERMADPNLYPRLRGARGVFKVKLESVANYLLVKRTWAGQDEKIGKVKPADIAAYLLQNAVE